VLAVPCTFDFNVAATKYFYALEHGEVPLLFLFSGTVFYDAPDGRLQIQKISWEKECAWRMPIAHWQELMEHHYPDSAWIAMRATCSINSTNLSGAKDCRRGMRCSSV
jgi:hypothetical protein